ncbi:UDP-glucose 4-epimerase GalE [Heliobacterium gestii]|uniref:UDP-glucose 4-epimerase n=1 Tax=Heliomicrobium gestii TaxID=2699 RepID=A0A845LK09_HELGE|nr:UDP-glucose 4-epimerase GalE [Heliomicrobium gestii]MBM7866523.1 UDP-glucose 4-epimerase [Heliomicrobium gestii]MZP43196.1 UDP-glucose 4-epimerase GalE [Heliomicrobium gestii]
MKYLVTGGAGYIGSHTALALLAAGAEVVILDNLTTGHRELAPQGVSFYQGDVGDAALLTEIFATHAIDGVLHFAAKSLVGESMRDPGGYFLANTGQTAVLLQAMAKSGVRRFVLSSTAAVYGEPEQVPIPEDHPVRPTNPYGLSKQLIEAMLPWFERVHGIRWMALRYFNVAGADPDGRSGECHEPETHLIPNVLQVAEGKREFLSLFGDDYPTPDGTCIRDYIHVSDLADAHVLALQALANRRPSGVCNLGNGQGFSVLQVVERARRVTGHPIPLRMEPRRPGDPAVLVASNARATAELGWRPRHGDLSAIIETAWRWQSRRGDKGL